MLGHSAGRRAAPTRRHADTPTPVAAPSPSDADAKSTAAVLAKILEVCAYYVGKLMRQAKPDAGHRIG